MSKPKRTPPKPPVTVPGGPRAMRNAKALTKEAVQEPTPDRLHEVESEFLELYRLYRRLPPERRGALVKQLLRAADYRPSKK